MTQISGTRPDERIGAGLMKINGCLLVVVQNDDQDMNELATRAVESAWRNYDFDVDERWRAHLASQHPPLFSAKTCAKVLLLTPLALPLAMLIGAIHGVQDYLGMWEDVWVRKEASK